MEAVAVKPLSACLLQWMQSFDGLRKVGSLEDLSNGLNFWLLLQDIDPDYFTGELPEPDVTSSSDWTRKWQNLKHVEKQVALYYRDVCNGQEDIGVLFVPDLKAIAASSSVQDIEKLIMVIIRAVMASPESNQKMAQRLMSLGRDNAMVIANGLRDMETVEEMEYTESEPTSQDESAYQSEQEIVEQETPKKMKANGSNAGRATYHDPLLEREEELLKAEATIDRLQANQAAAQQQLQELKQDKERLQEAFDLYRDEIEAKGRKTGGDDAIKKLQRQSANDKAYIDDLEGQLQSSRSAMDNYERQIQRQKDESDSNQKLRDDLQLLRADNEDLNHKLKANENLKKKIQTLQEQEKINVQLRDELKSANERIEELDRLKLLQAGLEKEIIEKKGLIRNQEYQINELTTIRKHAEYDARVLAQKLQEARERHDRDHDAMEDLRSKLRESDLDDTAVEDDESSAVTGSQVPSEPERKVTFAKTDETKHLAEKLALVESQLEAADTRLKQVTERNAALEERQQGINADSDARQKAEQQLSEHEATITSLRKGIENKQQVPQAPASSADMKALQRENRLMATAWYDLSSRLQNNGVSLGRRRQEPKSWIGKQRALVGPGSGMQR